MKNVNVKGIICTVTTPFNEDDTINEELLRNEVRYILNANVDGICACGTTGEGNTLSPSESAQVIRVVVDEVKGRFPVVAGIIQNSTTRVIEYGKALKEAGADVLQITPIHYLFNPGLEGTVEYYKQIGEALDMPIIIYNVVPWAMVQIDALEKLADLPHIIGIKQSGGAINLLASMIIRLKDKISILAALDDLHFPSIALGAHGLLAALPTITPHLTVKLWNETRAGNFEEGRRIHELVFPIWQAVDGPNMPARLKEALRLQGRPAGKARSPIQPVTEQEREKIWLALKNANLLAKQFEDSHNALV